MIHEKLYLREGRTDVTLTTYINEHSQEFLHDTRRPAVLICPGGAYLTCSDGEGEPVAMAFNAMGYNAYVLRYSTYMAEKPGIPMPGDPLPVNENCLFPKPMQEIGLAMQAIIDHADEWLTDPKQIAICGFSAGGHNCGMYSVYWKEYGMPKPAAAILGYPLADYRLTNPSPTDAAMSTAQIGRTTMTDAEKDTFSILKHISADTPPMFIWCTSEDEMVPCKNSLLLGAALSDAGIPCEVHMFANGPHGLSTSNDCSAIIPLQSRMDVAQWVPMAHTWLKKRFSINLIENLPF